MQVVSLAPDRAASYNNRAQCLRLAGRAAEALADLDTAVRLSGGGRGRAGAAARCQRGVLLRRVRGQLHSHLELETNVRVDFTIAEKALARPLPTCYKAVY